jgi:hypothetical protein
MLTTPLWKRLIGSQNPPPLSTSTSISPSPSSSSPPPPPPPPPPPSSSSPSSPTSSSAPSGINKESQLRSFPYLNYIYIGPCSQSGSAEMALNPFWSFLITGKFGGITFQNNKIIPGSKRISAEIRRYFDPLDQDSRGFASIRVGNSKNLGIALGKQFSRHSITTIIGAYVNYDQPQIIKPIIGIHWNVTDLLF